MDKEHKKLIIQMTIPVVCVAFIVLYFITHKDDLNILRNIQLKHIALLIMLNILINVIYSLKLLLVLRKLGLTSMTYIQWLYIFLVSRFINLHITQGAILYRSIQLKNQFGFSYTKSISLNTFFAWFETLLLFIYSFFIFTFFDRTFMLGPVSILSVLWIAIIAVLLLPFIAQYVLNLKFTKHAKTQWVLSKLNELATDITEGIKDISLVLRFIAYNFVKFILQLVWMYICLDALNLQIGISSLVLLVIVIQLMGTMRFIPGNLGIAEVIYGYITKLIGWGLGVGIIISAIQRAVVYLAFLLWGIFFIWPYKFLQSKKASG